MRLEETIISNAHTRFMKPYSHGIPYHNDRPCLARRLVVSSSAVVAPAVR